MVQKIKLQNSLRRDMQICIEPIAQYIDWGMGKFVGIELRVVNDKYNDELDIALTDLALVIYECRQHKMKVFIDGEVKYCTPEGGYL